MYKKSIMRFEERKCLDREVPVLGAGAKRPMPTISLARAFAFTSALLFVCGALAQDFPWDIPEEDNPDKDYAVHITANLQGWSPNITDATPPFDGAEGGKIWVYTGANVDVGDGRDGDLTNPNDPRRIISGSGMHYFRRIDCAASGGSAPTLEIQADDVTIRCQYRFAPEKIIWKISAKSSSRPKLKIFAGQCLRIVDPPQYCLGEDGFRKFDTEYQPHRVRVQVEVVDGDQATHSVPGPELLFCTSARGNIDGILDAGGSKGNLTGKGGDGGLIAVQAPDRDVELTTPSVRGGTVQSWFNPPKGGRGGNGGLVGIAGRSVQVDGYVGASGGNGGEDAGDGGDGGVISIQAAEFNSTSPCSIFAGRGDDGPGSGKGNDGQKGTVDIALSCSEQYLLPSAFAYPGITSGNLWTIMVYLAGDDGLHWSGSTIEPALIRWIDACENVYIGDKPVKVVVQLDRYSPFLPIPGLIPYEELNIPGDASWGDWNNTRRGLVVYDGNEGFISTVLTPINGYSTESEANTGAPESLADFVNWAATNYPAANYALVLHGHGSSYGLLPDATTDIPPYKLSFSGLGKAFEMMDPNVHIGPVSVIACTLQRIETASELCERADYLIAPQDLEEPGRNRPEEWLQSIVSQPNLSSAELARKIYDASHERSKALIDLRNIGEMNNLILALTRCINPQDQLPLYRARDKADYYYRDVLRDLKQFLVNLADAGSGVNAEVQRLARLVLDYWPKVVLATPSAVGGQGRYGGLNVTFPKGYPSGDDSELNLCQFWCQTGFGKLVDLVGGIGILFPFVEDAWTYDLPDSATSAKNAGILQSQSSVLYSMLAQGGDKDFIAFTNPRQQELRIVYSGDTPPSNSTVWLTLLGTNRTTVIQRLTANNNSFAALSISNLLAGTYYLGVEIKNNGSAGGTSSNDPAFYSLRLSAGDSTTFAPKIQVADAPIIFDTAHDPLESIRNLHIANDGLSTLVISNFVWATNSSFLIANPIPLPITIDPGSFVDVPIALQDDYTPEIQEVIHVLSNDPLRPDVSVILKCQAGFDNSIVLHDPRCTSGLLTFTVNGASNSLVAIERSTNLVHWTQWSLVPSTNQAATVQIPLNRTEPRQFYRARCP